MKVETQQPHHRLHGKVVMNNTTSSNPMDLKTAVQQKDEEYKRLTENTMQVCNVNVNLMENSLASR